VTPVIPRVVEGAGCVEARRPRPGPSATLGMTTLVVLAIALWIYFGPIPEISQAETPRIVDRNGLVLYEPLSARGDRNEWLHADALPPMLVRATVAAEDKRFFTHLGIDARAVGRAAWHDVKRLKIVEGGSTITQQVAKLLRAKRDRGVVDKVREAVIAIRLERRYTKKEILALYLNLAPYGNQVTGIARASRHYFGCAPEDLTAAQSAFLASLPRRPGSIDRAVARRQDVLAKMHLTDRELAAARAERLRFERGQRTVLAQHFIERVMWRTGNPACPDRQDCLSSIHTTLDGALQRSVAGIIAAQKDELLAHGAHSVAVAVLDNHSGEWLAWEGSGDYFGSDFGGAIDGVVTQRQPGSALKPFTYAAAFERGETPATVLADVPSSFPTAEAGVIYTPRNYDGQYRGPLRVRSALAGSENVPAVAMASRVGPASLLRFLRRAGFRDFTRTADYYGLGLTLGDAEVRLEQLVAAYASFARGGVYIEPRMLRDAQPARTVRVMSERTAFWITDILSDADAREFVFGRGGSLEFPFPVAAKTGTSQAYRDNWTVGYTRDVTVGVWVGNFDRSALRNSSGVTGAGPIFHAVMLAAAKRPGVIVDVPRGLERMPICALSGRRPSMSCPNVIDEWLPVEAPVEFCSWHHEGYVDLPGEYRVGQAILPVRRVAGRGQAGLPVLHILSPPDNATYLIDPTLRKDFQTLKLRASKNAKWHIDAKEIASAEWPLIPGHHTIIATDATGARDEVRIVVK
jgi:penicillin-binding protein 1C